MQETYSEFIDEVITIKNTVHKKNRTIYVPRENIQMLYNKIVKKYPKFKENVALEDFEHFITDMIRNEKKIGSINNHIKTFFKEDVKHTFKFFFILGNISGFSNGYQLGNGKLFQLKHMGEKIKQTIDSYNENDWFMLIEVNSKGVHNASIIAIREYRKNICIHNICSGSIKYADNLTKFISRQEYKVEKNGEPIIHIYSPAGFHLSTTPEIDIKVTKFNEIIKPNLSEIERRIIKVLDITSIIDEDTQLHVRFLLFTIALETLLLGKDDRDYLRKKFAEKITYLIGIKYALKVVNVEEVVSNNNIIDELKLILNLEKKITTFYDNRSIIAHSGINDNINTKDVEDIATILIIIIEKLFDLIETEKLTHISKTSINDNASLDFYMSKLKYGTILS